MTEKLSHLANSLISRGLFRKAREYLSRADKASQEGRIGDAEENSRRAGNTIDQAYTLAPLPGLSDEDNQAYLAAKEKLAGHGQRLRGRDYDQARETVRRLERKAEGDN